MTRNQKLKYGSGIVALVAGGQAFAVAVPPDLSTLTGAIDLSTVVTAIIAVAVLLMAPQITKYAISAVRRMFPK